MPKCCSCGSHGATGEADRAHEIWMANLGEAGLRDIGQQALDVRVVVASAVDQIRRSERAEALELGADVAALSRRGAERDVRHAVRQLRAVRQQIENRVGADDWRELSARMDEAIASDDGRAAFQDLRDHWSEWALDSGLESQDAREVVDVWDEVTGVAQNQGSSELLKWFDGQLGNWIEALEAPDMGRAPRSPQSANRVACLVVVGVLTAAAVVACFLTPFCWCCYGWWIALAAAASVAACLTIP